MKKAVWIFIAVMLIASVTGCASIVSKSDYPVNISSNPQGADITIVNRAGQKVFSGKTPTTVTLKAGAGYFKGETYTVTFSADGHKPHTAQIQRDVDAWYIAGNILFGGLIGWFIVDPLTGAMWTLDDLHGDLSPEAAASAAQQIHILTLEQAKDLPGRRVRIN